MPGMPTDGEIRAVSVYNVPGAGLNDEYVVVTNEPPTFSPNQQSVVRTGTPDSLFVTLKQEFDFLNVSKEKKEFATQKNMILYVIFPLRISHRSEQIVNQTCTLSFDGN
jgi:hypothetical protein